MRKPSKISANRTYDKPERPSVWKSTRLENLAGLSSTPVPFSLLGGLAIVLGVVIYGLILLHKDSGAFRMWIREDGLAEWLTCIELLIMAAYSFTASFSFERSTERKAAKRTWFFLGLLFLFGAMEEISWGQRLLGIESPEWFLLHNRQGETNIHNLVVYGANLNKLIFGKMLSVIVVMYVVVMPLLCRFRPKVKAVVSRYGIPMAQHYQVLLFIIATLVLSAHLSLSKKVSELVEFSICYVMLMILVHPDNGEILPFRSGRASARNAALNQRAGEES